MGLRSRRGSALVERASVEPRLSRRRYGSLRTVISVERIRELALALPTVLESDHHGRPSFRVDGRIFATIWDERQMNVLLDEPGIHTAVQRNPDACREFWWGRRLRAVQLQLDRADESLAADLLADAWECKAPKRLPRLPAR